MAQTFSFEEALQPAAPSKASSFDAALQAEGVTGKLADVARSIYTQESGGGKNTKTSNAGAVGGMQIIPTTFAGVADKGWDINNPEHNTRAGIRYLKQLDQQSGGDPALTAAGYYGGPGGMEKARKGIAVSDPRNPGAPNTLQYGQQVAARVPKGSVAQILDKVTDAIIPSAGAQELPSAKAGPAPATFSFEEALAPAPGAAPAAPKRSMIEDLGRQLGLATRMGVNAVAALPVMMSDAATGALNSGADLMHGKGVGYRFKGAGDSLNNLMTSAGVTAPENATERVVQDVGSALGGAAGMVKGGLALAKSASGPVTQGVGEMLAAGQKLQLASAATGAGAAGATREAGGGAGAQLAAGLVGSMVPVGKTYIGQTNKGNKQLLQAATKANENGYVVPPADLNPGIGIEALSGFSGKIKTAQTASQRNQTVTNQLARKALGVEAATDLTEDTLKGIRERAGQAYQSIAATGTITPSASYSSALDKAIQPFLSQAKSFPNRKVPALVDDIQALKTEAFDASDALDTIKVLRNDADAAYRGGDKLAGKAYKSAALALEDAIDDHLVTIKAPAEMLQGYRDARKTIAKTYTVGSALNSETGNVNAQKLAADLVKGKPLSAELKTIAEVSQAFPKATQALKESPKQFSPLDYLVAAGASGGGANPAMLAAVAARPVTRYALLSKYAQRQALKTAGGSSSDVKGIPAALVGAATRLNDTTEPPPQPAPQTFSFEEAQQAAAPAQPEANPARIELNGMAPGSNLKPESAPQETGGEGDAIDPDATQGAAEADPSQAFTSVQRPDGTLAISGDPQALHATLVASGIPARSIVRNAAGVMVGRSQAGRVQEAIARMGQPDPEGAAAAPAEMVAENQQMPMAPAGPGEPDQAGQQMAGADLAPPVGEMAPGQGQFAAADPASGDVPDLPAVPALETEPNQAFAQMEPAQSAMENVAPEVDQTAQTAQAEPVAEPVHPMAARIQRLKDAGEDQVASVLQRNHDREQTLGAVQAELAGLLEAAPDLPHHQNAHFQSAYQQQRVAGAKPAEAAARAGIIAAVQETAPGAGMPARAVAALREKLEAMPVDDAPGFVQRFTQALIAKGVFPAFEGADQIEQMLTHARDGSMNAMVDSVYRGTAG